MNKQQLANKIWESANKMRSKIEANDYKDYILGFIFYKFLSDKELRYLREQGATDADIRSDLNESNTDLVRDLQRHIGYFISYDNLFSTWIAKGSDFGIDNVRDALSAFSRLIGSKHKKVFDGIFETLQTGLSKLGDSAQSQTKAARDLIYLINDIPTDGKQGYDVLGFIYEYLISNFAANAGKKAGEFYTPHEVSLLMSEIVADHLKDRETIQIYDPTSGSGSLLLNIGSSVARHMDDEDKIKYYAQELKQNTFNLTRMNLVMRDIEPGNIVTRNADTLEDDWPYFDESDPTGTYDPLYVDAVVSNPPYSQQWEPEHKENDPRYAGYGVAPRSKADYAFLLHDLYHLKPDGIMTIILPHGVLFRGGEEGQIRRNLIESNNIDTIIGLPANIFFGTGIPTIIMVLKKQRSETTDVLFVDASKGFAKVGKNNELRASDIRRVVDAVTERKSIDKFSRVVSREEIRENDYNLNIPRYVDSSEPAESWDIYASMFGGIPRAELDGLGNYWEALPGLREALFETADSGYARLQVENADAAINEHPAVAQFAEAFNGAFDGFEQTLNDRLVQNPGGVAITREQNALAAEIFDRLRNVPLIDEYRAYQLLNDNWKQIELDLEMIQTEGTDALRKVEPNMVTKKVKGRDAEVQQGWVGRVLPFDLVQKQLLTAQTDALAENESRLATVTSSIDELIESLSEDDKLELDAVLNEDNTAFVAGALTKTAKEAAKQQPAGGWPEGSPQAIVLEAKRLHDEKATLAKAIKTGSLELDQLTRTTIENLSDEQAAQLLRAKWVEPIAAGLQNLPADAVAQLASKVKALDKKYETTLNDLDHQIAGVSAGLATMLGELVGSDTDMQALNQLKSLLAGE